LPYTSEAKAIALAFRTKSTAGENPSQFRSSFIIRQWFASQIRQITPKGVPGRFGPRQNSGRHGTAEVGQERPPGAEKSRLLTAR
jgi:hypothetical protein